VKVNVVTSGEMIRQVVIVPFSESEHTVSCFVRETLSTVVVQHHFFEQVYKGLSQQFSNCQMAFTSY
jgi:hypothetical protein